MGVLLHGPDAGLLALQRAELIAVMTGGDEMRLSRLEPGAIRKDPASVNDALHAQGFFPGRMVVLIEEARDGLAATLKVALEGATSDDAYLVVTAAGLAGRSALRKLFEGDKRLASLGLYPEAPDEAEIGRRLGDAGLASGATPDALAALAMVAGEMDAGSFQQLVRTVAQFGADSSEPLNLGEVEALLPQNVETALDDLVAAVADGRAGAVGPLMRRLSAAGTQPARILIATGAHFRRLLSVASAPDGPERALGRLRPPVFGQRRNAMVAQSRRWGASRLERGLRQIFDADRALRSAGERPDRAMVERALIRLAMTAG